MAQGKQTADFTTVKTANELFADKGGYVGFQAKSAEYNTSESAGGLSKKVDMLEDQTRMNNMMQGLANEGVQIKDFMQDGTNAKTGAALAAAMAGNRVKKFNMKDSLVSDSGVAVDFAMDNEGHIGKFSSDAVNSHAVGRVENNNRDIPASMTAFNALHHGNKDMQVGLDERGQFTGTPEAIKAFEKHYEHKQHAEAAARGVLGEFGGTLMDAASGITNEEMAELGMLGVVGGVAAYKLGGKSLISSIRGNPEKVSDTKNNSNQGTDGKASEKSNPETHGSTPKERYDFAQTQINESRANLNNYNQELSQLQGNNEALNEKIYKANNNSKMADAERASTLKPLNEQIEANNARISSLNQSIYDEGIVLEHRKNAASEALNHPDFGKEPKGKIGKTVDAVGAFSSNVMEGVQASSLSD